jgi:hypothetical protein
VSTVTGIMRIGARRRLRGMNTDLRSTMSSADRDCSPGPLAGVKRDATSDPGYPQLQAAEVESARLRLADNFIAEDRGQDTERFIDWARHVQRAAVRAARGSAASPSERT